MTRRQGQADRGSIEIAVLGESGVVTNRLEATAGAAAFAEFAVDAHTGADEQGNGGGQARNECNDTETLAGAFAELIGK